MRYQQDVPEIGGWNDDIINNSIYAEWKKILDSNNSKKWLRYDVDQRIKEFIKKEYSKSKIVGNAYRYNYDLGKL